MTFLFSRYSFLSCVVMQLVTFLPGNMTDTRCRHLNFTAFVFACVAGAAAKLLFILRVYAVFGRKRSLLILLSPFIIVGIVGAALIYSNHQQRNTYGAILAMFWEWVKPSVSNVSMSTPFLPPVLYIVAPFFGLTFDSVIFILTLIPTAHHIMQLRTSGISSVAEVILRDGTLYFFTLFITSGIEAAFALHSVFSSGIRSVFSGGIISNAGEPVALIVTAFLGVLPNLLINRFVLNLRAFSNPTNSSQYSGKDSSYAIISARSVPNFAESRFIGNMGAPLDHDQWDEVNDRENEVNHGDEVDGREIPNRTLDPLTTLVPVIYGNEKGCPITFVPMEWERGRCLEEVNERQRSLLSR
ncbi:hypothetical protein BDP27DRAFT_1450655 [Rhodocollybia butyracea]|uniref:Uncharacterized protein n=1 Tax=Rhodocollybia butyracea TaxID=206335 RepID=A0A9P5PLC7_9AGAR|nr:hypothetical protein BDP27DRAFT_1450655 [Rhodocollybia butyracea]